MCLAYLPKSNWILRFGFIEKRVTHISLTTDTMSPLKFIQKLDLSKNGLMEFPMEVRWCFVYYCFFFLLTFHCRSWRWHSFLSWDSLRITSDIFLRILSVSWFRSWHCWPNWTSLKTGLHAHLMSFITKLTNIEYRLKSCASLEQLTKLTTLKLGNNRLAAIPKVITWWWFAFDMKANTDNTLLIDIHIDWKARNTR